jgi:hypothetical protein
MVCASRRTKFSQPNRHERPPQNQSSRSNHPRGGVWPSRYRDPSTLPAETFRIPCISGCFGQISCPDLLNSGVAASFRNESCCHSPVGNGARQRRRRLRQSECDIYNRISLTLVNVFRFIMFICVPMLAVSANRLRVIHLQYRGADDDSGCPRSSLCNQSTTARRSYESKNISEGS